MINTHGDYPQVDGSAGRTGKSPFHRFVRPKCCRYSRKWETAKSREWLTWLRPGEHPNYPEGIEDNTHLNEQGAEAVARMAADAIIKLNLNLG